jgi:hypothetical protein
MWLVGIRGATPQRVGEYFHKSGQEEPGYSPANFTSKQLQQNMGRSCSICGEFLVSIW